MNEVKKKTHLSGFTRDKIKVEGKVELEVELGTTENVLKTTMEFMVVNTSCVHNAILRWSGITKTRAIISITHLSMKVLPRVGFESSKAIKSSSKVLLGCHQED